MKTSDLQGAALDWAVAKCEGAETWNDCSQILLVGDDEPYHPSTTWAQGGPIIEREKIDVCVDNDGWFTWYAKKGDVERGGATPLIAAMRCYVASKLGDEIDIPEELK